MCRAGSPGDKGTDKGGTDKGGKSGKGGKDCNTGKGQSGNNPPGNSTSTDSSTGHLSGVWKPVGWDDNAPPWQSSDSWQPAHDDSWGHWPATISATVPNEPVTGPMPADSAAATALAAAESAHNSEQAASAHAAAAQTAADEAADFMTETSTVLGDIRAAIKQFGKCNVCKKWYFVHKDLCIFPGCSRNPMTSQIDSMAQQIRTLHDQVTSQEALINTMLHSTGTSSSSTTSPAVLQAQAQQISALTAIIAQMVQHSAVSPSTSTLTVWQGPPPPQMTVSPRKPQVPSSAPPNSALNRMVHEQLNGSTTGSQAAPLMQVRPKARPAMPLQNITNIRHPAPHHHLEPALEHRSDHLVAGADPPAPHHDGGPVPHAEPTEHAAGDDDEDEDDDNDCDEEDDIEPGAAGEGGPKPNKKRKKLVGKKGGIKKRKHSSDQ